MLTIIAKTKGPIFNGSLSERIFYIKNLLYCTKVIDEQYNENIVIEESEYYGYDEFDSHNVFVIHIRKLSENQKQQLIKELLSQKGIREIFHVLRMVKSENGHDFTANIKNGKMTWEHVYQIYAPDEHYTNLPSICKKNGKFRIKKNKPFGYQTHTSRRIYAYPKRINAFILPEGED